MKRSTTITLVILLSILLVVGYIAFKTIQNRTNANGTSTAAAQVFTSASTARNFTDIQGNDANLEQHLGAVIVAHAWASWVPTSPESLRNLSELQSQYAMSDVAILAINRGEPVKTAQSFLNQNNISNIKLIADSDDRYFSTVEGRTMPETIFYDRDGNVVFHKRGVMSKGELQMRINQALEVGE